MYVQQKLGLKEKKNSALHRDQPRAKFLGDFTSP